MYHGRDEDFLFRGLCRYLQGTKIMITREEIKKLPKGDQLTPGTSLWYGVHMSNCCARHGCRYHDADCPVEKHLAPQDVVCEDCFEDPERYNQFVVEYWGNNYTSDPNGICTLCGNTGILDTTESAISPTGFRVGKKHYCICKNGQSLRYYGNPVE